MNDDDDKIEETEKYHEELEEGFKSFVRKALRAKEEEIKAAEDSSRRQLLDPSIEGFLLSDEEKKDSEPFLFLKFDKSRRGDEHDIYNCYYFCSPCCTASGLSNDKISCDDCASTFRTFRRKCVRRARSKAKGYAKQRKDSISSPSQVQVKATHMKKDLQSTRKMAKYYKVPSSVLLFPSSVSLSLSSNRSIKTFLIPDTFNFLDFNKSFNCSTLRF